jgi:hypothetical protein
MRAVLAFGLGLTLSLVVVLSAAKLCQAEPAVIATPSSNGEKVRANQTDSEYITPEQISKAYMNCLMDVDMMVADMVEGNKNKARRAEREAQLSFCLNRKNDCKNKPNSPGCRVFIEEFVTDHR